MNSQTHHNRTPARSSVRLIATLLLLATLLVILASRVSAPSDLLQNADQSKTAAFTADIALNGRWIMPRDNSGSLAKKPPLINWIGAPLYALGLHDEWAIKAPALLSGLVVVTTIFFSSRWLFITALRDDPRVSDANRAIVADAFALAACCIWVASPVAMKNFYFLRPDILLVAMTTLGWACATVAIGAPADRAAARPPRWAWIGMWACTGLGILAKGPAALLVVIYAIVYALAVHRSLRSLNRTRWWFGIPIMLAIGAAWLVPAWIMYPEHIRETILGEEMMGRLQAGAGEGRDRPGLGLRQLIALYRVPSWCFERFMLGAGLFIIGLFLAGRRMLRCAATPAIVWTLTVLAIMIIIGARGGSYQDPAYPQGAIVGAWGIMMLTRRRHAAPAPSAIPLMAIMLAIAIGLGVRELYFSRGAESGSGEALKQFIAEVRTIVPSDERIAFVALGNNPLPTLMGAHPGHHDIWPSKSEAEWIISEADLPAPPVITSEPLYQLEADTGEPVNQRLILALYRRGELADTSPGQVSE